MLSKSHLNAFHINFLPWLSVFFLLSLFVVEKVPGLEKEDVDQQKEKIERVEKYILDHQEKLLQSSMEEKGLIDKLRKIDHMIFLESRKFVNLQQQIQEHENMIKEKQAELEKLEKEKQILKEHIQKRLVAYYQMGDIGLINTVFSTSSLSELLNFREIYKRMVNHDKQSFTSFKDKIKAIVKTGKELEEERLKLEDAISQAKDQQKILAEKRREQENILETVKTREALYQNALTEMKNASRELQMTLNDLEDIKSGDGDGPIIDHKKKKPNSEEGFAGQKGLLNPPVFGKVIKKFNNNPEDKDKFIFSEGINIRTDPGEKIKAVYRGKIIYAGMLPGYGKIIILDHGDHYVSLVSGIASFVKEVGEEVEEGEVIATASLHSGLLQDGIHFEIRHKTEPSDPLLWLDPLNLK